MDERTGVVHNYERKSGVVVSEIITPDGGTAERGQLWNAAEQAEKRKDARTGRDWTVALPAELNAEQRAELARSFGRELASRYGVAVDVAVHLPDREGDNRNHHAHLLTTTRQVSRDPDGQLVMGDKATIELSDKARLARGLGRAADEVTAVRQRWEQLANDALERAGRDERIDARSLQAQGVEREATAHLGPIASEMERRGVASDRGNGNRQARANNDERAKLSAQIIDLQAERKQRDQARVERMSAAELRGEIARMRPGPITQDVLLSASSDYSRAHTEAKAVQLAAQAQQQQQDNARSEANQYRSQLTHWQAEHPIAAKLHSLGLWRNKQASAIEDRAAIADQRSIEAEKRRIPLASQSEQLGRVEQSARQRAQGLVEDQRKPTYQRIAELEKIAQQKKRQEQEQTRETRAMDNAVKVFKTHALQRELRAYGYSDTGEHWRELPATLRKSIDDFNRLPKEARPQALAVVREHMERRPEMAEYLTRDRQRSQDRGFSR